MRFLWLLITPCLLRLSPSPSQPHTAAMVAIPFKLLNGQTFMVEADPSFTILQVKQQVEVGVILRAGARTGAQLDLFVVASVNTWDGSRQTMACLWPSKP